jgi:hypothetical protein
VVRWNARRAAAGERRDLGAADPDAAARRPVEARDGATRGRLARARLPDEGVGRAARDGERHVVDGDQRRASRAANSCVRPETSTSGVGEGGGIRRRPFDDARERRRVGEEVRV